MSDKIYMFGIPLFENDGFCDVMEDGIQYHAIEWELPDMKKYNNKYVVIGFNGSLKIYEESGELLLDGSLLDSQDFCRELRAQTINGTHDEMVGDIDWRDIKDCPSFTDVYLKCKLIRNILVCVGQLNMIEGCKVKSDVDPDIFFRSKIIGWKPIREV